MIIAQISDTHITAPAAEDGAPDSPGAARRDTLARCVEDINDQGVDLVIHTGDGVHRGEAGDYRTLKSILSGLETPLLVTPGNRDSRDALRGVFADHPHLPMGGDFLHYAVEDYPVRLVALDSTSPGERKGVFCAERLSWLEETLSREPRRPTILFVHHPPFDIGSHYVGGYRRQEEADDLTALVARHKQVVRVLCGHVHCLYGTAWAATVATTMPSVALDLRNKVDTGIEPRALYLLHHVSDGGVVESRTRFVPD